jgi:hypothetical protein
MVDELEYTLPDFRGKVSRVRCFNHVLNLVAKSILCPFTKNLAANFDDLPSAEDGDMSLIEDDDDPDQSFQIEPIVLEELRESGGPIAIAL